MADTDLVLERLHVLFAADSIEDAPGVPPPPDDGLVLNTVGEMLRHERITPIGVAGLLGLAVGETAVRGAWGPLDAHVAGVAAAAGTDEARRVEQAIIVLEGAALRWGARFGYALARSPLATDPTADTDALLAAFRRWWRAAHAAATDPEPARAPAARLAG